MRLIVLGEPRTAKPKTITLAERDRAHGVRIGDALGAQWRDLEPTPDGPVFNVQRQHYRR